MHINLNAHAHAYLATAAASARAAISLTYTLSCVAGAVVECQSFYLCPPRLRATKMAHPNYYN